MRRNTIKMQKPRRLHDLLLMQKWEFFTVSSVRFSTLSMMSVMLSRRPSNLKYDQAVLQALVGHKASSR